VKDQKRIMGLLLELGFGRSTDTMAALEMRSHVRLSGPEFAKQLSEVLTEIPRAAVSCPYPKFPERPFEVIT
jgi:hypothetical protein